MQSVNDRRFSSATGGSRARQEAIRCVFRHEVIRALAQATQGQVVSMLLCPHAHHVLQALIVALPPANVDFFISELEEAGWTGADTAKHRFGCQVLERMLEHFSGNQSSYEALMTFLNMDDNVAELCRHSFGKYVVQHVVDHGHLTEKSIVFVHGAQNLAGLAEHGTGACVLDTVLTLAPPDLRQMLAADLVDDGSFIRGLLENKTQRDFQRNIEFMIDRVIFAASQHLLEQPAIWDAIPSTHSLRAVLQKRYAGLGASHPAEPMALGCSEVLCDKPLGALPLCAFLGLD